MTTDLPPKKNLTVRFAGLLGLIIVLCVGWTIAWFAFSATLTTSLDNSIFKAENTGIGCGDRQASGYPFRMVDTCEGVTLAGFAVNQSFQAEAARLKVTALPYYPGRPIFELFGPAVLQTRNAGEIARAEWDQARASLRLSSDMITRLDAEATELDLQLAGLATASADNTQVHLRQTPETETSLDAAFSARGLGVVINGLSGRFDRVSVVSTVTPALSAFYGEPGFLVQEWQQNGAVFDITEARLDLEGGYIAINGELRADRIGTLTGALTIEMSDVAVLGDVIEQFTSDVPSAINLALLALRGYGNAVDNTEFPNARQYVVTLDEGRVQVEGLTLYTLPPLFLLGS